MKKSLFASFALLVGILPVFAEGLSADRALERALGSMNQSSTMRVRGLSADRLKLVYSGAELEQTKASAFYVFGREADGGFIIASGDDRLRPVLAVADSGTFSADNMPENLRYWLGEYEAEIRAALSTASETASATSSSDNIFDNYASWTPVEPIVKTRWNQTSPFNNLCPMMNGKRCMTGCVATAMAQVINAIGYYDGKGVKTYTPGSLKTPVSFDYGAWTPDFSKMHPTCDATATADEINEVAKLMFACGVAVEMNYTPQSSGAGQPLDGLKRWFGYDESSAWFDRENFATPQWESIVYDQIKAGRPVFYSGSGSGGHAFVCDGYQGDGLFHFNWGWGGISDGYFALSALNPRDQGVGSFAGGYNHAQQITIFVKPGTPAPEKPAAARPVNLVYQGELKLPTATGQVDFFPLLYTLSDTPDGQARTVGLSMLLRDPEGKKPEVFLAPTAYKSVGVFSSAWNFTVDFSKVDVAPGTYLAYPAYDVQGLDGYWEAHNYYGSKFDHYELTVGADGSRTYTIKEIINPGIEAYDIKVNELYAGDKDNTVEFMLVNYSDADFAEPLSVRMVASDGTTSTLATSYMYLQAGVALPMKLSFNCEKAGKFTLRLYRDKYDLPIGDNSLDVAVNSGKRPDSSTPVPAGMCEVALWADGAYQPLAPAEILAGAAFGGTTALNSLMPQTLDYYIAFFTHGQTSGELCKYQVALKSVQAADWSRGDDFSVTPSLAPGTYTMAFVDKNGTLLSYPVDFYVGFADGGLAYRVNEAGEAVVTRATGASAEVTVPETASYAGTTYDVREIAADAFSGDSELVELTVGAGIRNIGLNAFRATRNLQRVYFRGTDAPFENSVIPFFGTNSKAVFYVDAANYANHAKAYHSTGGLYALITALSAPSTATVMATGRAEVALEITPAEHFNPDFTVQVSNPDVLEAEMEGSTLVVRGLNPGDAEVSITSAQPGVDVVKLTVTVTEYEGISLNMEEAALNVGDELKLTATVSPAALEANGLVWTSSDDAIVSVEADGTLKAVEKGEAVITAAVNGKPGLTASCRITVTRPVTDIYVEVEKLEMEVGDEVTVSAHAIPENASNVKLNWKSSNTTRVIVSPLGVLTARYKGSATITVSSDSNPEISKTIEVTVNAKSAIESVEAVGESEVEYFDLAGRKVERPSNGVFIRRTGNTSVLIRL